MSLPLNQRGYAAAFEARRHSLVIKKEAAGIAQHFRSAMRWNRKEAFFCRPLTADC
ncbi:MAG: hypothetical protein ABL999_14785 [Pyrinomonadaceae bacterium]